MQERRSPGKVRGFLGMRRAWDGIPSGEVLESKRELPGVGARGPQATLWEKMEPLREGAWRKQGC